MRLLALVAGLAALSSTCWAQAPQADANAPKPVIELFTSQGCSSCPPADALLRQYSARDDLIALSYPVDYWDYLGWKDTLASPRFSERQRAYAKARHDGLVYTPQMVVNGLVHVNGSARGAIEQAVAKTTKSLSSSHIPIRLSVADGKLTIQTGAAPENGSTPTEATLWLLVIARSVQVAIDRGENAGKTVTYSNVVRDLLPVGTWSGKPLTVRLERQTFMRPGADRCAALLQQATTGPIIGAALLDHF
ncbi:MAG TPA: DUF1223 domain-containing protein [Hyphomicrobiaceae bacterium]|nr:DUF1223 domain-containing protein [Hyphomicrobiaceae bacterium]